MDIIQLDSIDKYCEVFGFTHKHPLIAVVECNEPEKLKPHIMNWGFYALYLKDMASCTITYGKTHYDHGDKSIIAFAPGQVSEFEAIPGKDPKFIGLLFHPDFIHGTALGQSISQYSFFSYMSNEALHLSPSEFSIIKNLLAIISMELEAPTDHLSKELLCENIKLLLDYCVRFYDRQFRERRALNSDVLIRFENLLHDYLAGDMPRQIGVPTIGYFADKICLSPNYFGDLIKKDTGVSAKKYLQQKMLEAAKERLADPRKSVTQVSESLGFQYVQHFVRFFKQMTGLTPSQFSKNQ